MKLKSQWERVEDVMKRNGGIATLGFLYSHVKVSDWATKTPFASIRRILQVNKRFFKLKLGLWGLTEIKEEIIAKFGIAEQQSEKQEQFNHSYFQGLLVEIGNLKGYSTYIPSQDKNKRYLNQALKEITSLDTIYQFTYPEIVNKAKTVDTIWFNNRKMPFAFFEVEHSTDIYNSLIKFSELQDFNSRFNIVSDIVRKREYDAKINKRLFSDIRDKVKFISYDQISDMHSSMYKYHNAHKELNL